MMVTSAQHVGCYASSVGKGDVPWRRSSRLAERSSRGCLLGCADPIPTVGTRSKALASEHN